jgi:NitT/TauT family transport system substrate-binding protein
MPRFIIQPHTRIQEWVALENGYFADEGLDYELEDSFAAKFRNPTLGASGPPAEIRIGAFEHMAGGRTCDVSSACHWAVNMAATADHGRMWGHAYSVTPSAIWVPPESPIRRPGDLAGQPIAVGFHSGSHFSALQALERVLPASDVTLAFVGLPFDRVQLLLDRRVAAANVFGTAGYVLEQQGFRKVVDTSFMIGFLVKTGASDDDLQKYFGGLRRAQRDIDVDPERYKHYLVDELPEIYKPMLDTRACGTGERIVFEPYTREMYERTHRWMLEHDLFEGAAAAPRYDDAVHLLQSER